MHLYYLKELPVELQVSVLFFVFEFAAAPLEFFVQMSECSVSIFMVLCMQITSLSSSVDGLLFCILNMYLQNILT